MFTWMRVRIYLTKSASNANSRVGGAPRGSRGGMNFWTCSRKGAFVNGDKREGVLEFPGSQRTDVAQCPQPLKQVLENNYPLYESYFVRTLYHVKLVFHENRFCEAKAYLGIDHLWKKISGEILEGRGKWGIIG